MIVAVCVAGGLATVLAWRVVVARGVSVWAVMGAEAGLAGLAAALVGRPSLSDNVEPALAAVAGAASGAALYAATVAFVALVRRWPAFDRHVAGIYGLRKGLSLGAALVMVAVIYAPGEELFWRGLVQGALGDATSPVMGGVLSWAAYVVANLASASLPIVAGAAVAGAAWTGLALWSGGVLASILSHAVWTALMLAWPPGGASRTRDPDGSSRAAPGAGARVRDPRWS